MSSLPEKQEKLVKKVITKKTKAVSNTGNATKRMTRFNSSAKNCGICYSPIETQGVLNSCQHEFCFSCIEKWSQTENTCPMCKQRFSRLKKVWNRPFYGQKQQGNSTQNVSSQAQATKPEEEKEIEVPTRNQRQNNEEANVFFVEHLLNIMLTSLPRFPGSEDFSIEILFHERSSNVTATIIPISLNNFLNLE